MAAINHFARKLLQSPDLAQVSFAVAVLDKYLGSADIKVTRTDSVGRVKAATWSVDFGIASDEKTIHLAVSQLSQKLPEKERDHWLSFADGSQFSDNYIKMLSSHACIDDGNLRAWGEEAGESFF